MKKPVLVFLCLLALMGNCVAAASEEVQGSTVAYTQAETAADNPAKEDYLLITAPAADIFRAPAADSEKIGSAATFDKLTLLAEVTGQQPPEANTNVWYRVLIPGGSGWMEGYVFSPFGTACRVVRHYDTKVPAEIGLNLQYTNYAMYNDYVLITSSTANIRQYPTTVSPKIGTAYYFNKLQLKAEVKGQWPGYYNTDIWYKVTFQKGTETLEGYILSSLAVSRTFQFDKMVSSILKLQSEVDYTVTAYINNYKIRTGFPPLYHGSTVDAYGIKRSQSAPAYLSADYSSEFRYIQDGSLVTILGESGMFYKIMTLQFEGAYFVPKRYISLNNSIDSLTKVIVIDRKNQNEGVFEYIEGKWNLISYTYATTGANEKYKEPTPLGYFMAIAIQPRFIYLDDITQQIDGDAPYAIRFTGGAYIHGVPVDAVIVNGIPIFQPIREYSYTIGSIPLSHKCVRNYTSHALFLYHWITIGKSAVIVME